LFFFVVSICVLLDIARAGWEREKQSITPWMLMRESEIHSRKMKRSDRKVAGRSVVSRGTPTGCGRLSAAAELYGTDRMIGDFF
jgi:hypothetical protein